MIINHNLSSIFAARQEKLNVESLNKVSEKLASGMRINRAADDAAGLAVSEKMRAQIRGLAQATRNAEDMISLIQTAEGYLQETGEVLHRIRELSIQAANGIYTLEDRMQIQVEVSQLVDEVDRIASHAQFNTLNLLTGRYAPKDELGNEPIASMWGHIGANMDQRERVYIGTMTAKALGIRNVQSNEFVSVSTPDLANRTIGDIDLALFKVNKQRADLGAYQNRFEYAIKGLMIGEESLQAAESRIRDANMARESIDWAKDQVLLQTSIAMLAQANTRPQYVLNLIR